MDEPLPWEIPRFRHFVAVARVHQLTRKSMSDQLSDVGLDLPTYDVLSAVYRFPGMTQSELAEKLLVGRSNLSMLLPDIENKQWLRREADASDKRVKRLHLTEQGKIQATAGLRIQIKLIEYLSSPLTDEDCEGVGNSMRTIGQFLEKNPIPN